MKNLFILALICMSIMYSCERHPLPPPYYMIRQDFYLTDSSGNDLLSSNNEKVDLFSIKIYNLTNGREELNSTLYQNSGYSPDITYGFGINKPTENNEFHTLSINLNIEVSKDSYSYTIIEWNKQNRDTIKSEVIISREGTIATMVSYNGYSWSPSPGDDIFTIVK